MKVICKHVCFVVCFLFVAANHSMEAPLQNKIPLSLRTQALFNVTSLINSQQLSWEHIESTVPLDLSGEVNQLHALTPFPEANLFRLYYFDELQDENDPRRVWLIKCGANDTLCKYLVKKVRRIKAKNPFHRYIRNNLQRGCCILEEIKMLVQQPECDVNKLFNDGINRYSLAFLAIERDPKIFKLFLDMVPLECNTKCYVSEKKITLGLSLLQHNKLKLFKKFFIAYKNTININAVSSSGNSMLSYICQKMHCREEAIGLVSLLLEHPNINVAQINYSNLGIPKSSALTAACFLPIRRRRISLLDLVSWEDEWVTYRFEDDMDIKSHKQYKKSRAQSYATQTQLIRTLLSHPSMSVDNLVRYNRIFAQSEIALQHSMKHGNIDASACIVQKFYGALNNIDCVGCVKCRPVLNTWLALLHMLYNKVGALNEKLNCFKDYAAYQGRLMEDQEKLCLDYRINSLEEKINKYNDIRNNLVFAQRIRASKTCCKVRNNVEKKYLQGVLK